MTGGVNMKTILAACVLALMAAPAMAQTKSVYTDVSKCGGSDSKWDAFHHECKGLGGRTVSLVYVEGMASIVVDGDTDSPAAKAKIPVGGRGKVFGEKIEWRVRDGKACAVIARVSADKGSRLIVTSLGKPAQVIAVELTNKEAQKTSELACDSVGKPYTPDGEIDVELRGDWTLSGRCDDPNRLSIGPKAYTVTTSGQTFTYDKVERSLTFLHGANYEGKEYVWLGYNAAGDTFETAIVVNADEREGRIKVIPVSYDREKEYAGIADKPFKRCR